MQYGYFVDDTQRPGVVDTKAKEQLLQGNDATYMRATNYPNVSLFFFFFVFFTFS